MSNKLYVHVSCVSTILHYRSGYNLGRIVVFDNKEDVNDMRQLVEQRAGPLELRVKTWGSEALQGAMFGTDHKISYGQAYFRLQFYIHSPHHITL